MNTTRLTFDDVDDIFREACAELREATGECAPSTHTWLAPTLLRLAREVHSSNCGPLRGYREAVGDVNAPAVAYVWECNGPTLAVIHADADSWEVNLLLRAYMGLTD